MHLRKFSPRIPETLHNFQGSMIWAPWWVKMHEQNKMFSAVVVGKPGIGKSWLSCSLSQMMDRTATSGERFDVNRICFSPKEFSDVAAKNLPVGSFIIVDDAGLTMYSREAMTSAVRNLSKIFQSIRFKNLGIILNLPSWGMLDVNIRRLVSAYIEVTEVDRKTNMTYFKYMNVKTSPYSGDPMRYYPIHREPRTTVGGITWTKKYKITRFYQTRATKELLVQYEQKKSAYMGSLYKKYAAELAPSRSSMPVAYNYVKKNRERYEIEVAGKKKVDWGKILVDTRLGIRVPVIAKKIAKMLNEESAV